MSNKLISNSGLLNIVDDNLAYVCTRVFFYTKVFFLLRSPPPIQICDSVLEHN